MKKTISLRLAVEFALKLARIDLEESLEQGHLPDGMEIAAIKNQIAIYEQALNADRP